MSRNNNRSSDEEESDSGNSWFTTASVGLGLAAVAGGLYWLATRSSEPRQQRRDSEESDSMQRSSSTSDYLSGLMNRANIRQIEEKPHFQAQGISDKSIRENPYINNLDTLLNEIYLRYIAVKRTDFRHYYKVFDTIFSKIHETMKEVDAYYRQYSSTVQVAGSHFDRLRIKKPDEFDIDIFIGLPLNLKSDRFDPSKSDIVLESMSAGFVKLKMGTQFQKMPYRDNWETNKTLYSWRDDDFYLLRSKFSYWFKSLVNRALNQFQSYLCYVDGVPYEIGTSEAGPAITLKIRCLSTSFKMDIDLVPVLKFPEKRWPVWDGYREIPQKYRHENFMVVPKPIKGEDDSNHASRSWRMSLIYQERKMIDKTYHLRLTIKFLKKLRDTFGMTYLASYYVKTLFFWEVWAQNDPDFWQQSLAKLFTLMVNQLHAALSRRRVPYFWNDDYNLIQGAANNVVAGDVAKLAKLKRILDNPSEYKKVAEFLLTPAEYREFSKFL